MAKELRKLELCRRLGLQPTKQSDAVINPDKDGEIRIFVAEEDEELLEDEYLESLETYGKNGCLRRRPITKSDLKVEISCELGKRVFNLREKSPKDYKYEEYCKTELLNVPATMSRRQIKRYIRSLDDESSNSNNQCISNGQITSWSSTENFNDCPSLESSSKVDAFQGKVQRRPPNPLLELQLSQLKSDHSYANPINSNHHVH